MKKRKLIITAILLVWLIVLLGYSLYNGKNAQDLVYKEHLDETVAIVNKEKLTFRSMAFYVAYEEQQVEKQAVVYEPSDPAKYWNLHIDGEFIRVTARDTAMSMAIHDTLFYQYAMEEGLTLTKEDMASLESAENDFWSDLTEWGAEKKLGVTREDIHESMLRMTYAQKYQAILAAMSGVEYEDFDFNSEEYEDWLENQDYKIEKKRWKKVDFGTVTIVR